LLENIDRLGNPQQDRLLRRMDAVLKLTKQQVLKTKKILDDLSKRSANIWKGKEQDHGDRFVYHVLE
jgi:hypothetical protein